MYRQPPFGYHDTTTSLEDLIQGGIESVVFPARLPAAAIDFIKQLCQVALLLLVLYNRQQ